MSKTPQPPFPPGVTLVRMLPGLLVTVVAVAALLLVVDLQELRQAFSERDFLTLPIVVVLFLGTVASRAMAWRTSLLEQTSFKDSFFVLNQGYLLNNILPFRLGELGRAFLLGERIGLRFWRVLPTIVLERVFDLGFAAALLFTSLPYVIGAESANSGGVIALLFVLVVFLLLFSMASRPQWALKLVSALTRPWPKLQTWLRELLDQFLQGLSPLRQPPRFLRIAFWMLLTWLFNLAWYYVLMRIFFNQATWLWAAFAIAVASVGVALPSSPAYIGVLEIALVASLSLLGANENVALAYALVAHVIYFVITGILGIIGFWQQGSSLGAIYKQLLTRSPAK